MAAITSLQDALERMATKGFYVPVTTVGQTATTNSTIANGFFNVYQAFNGLGTTLFTTLVSAPTPNQPNASLQLANVIAYCNNSRGMIFGWLYKLGDLNLAATGDQFTHDAATFPVLRTRMGQAAQPVPLIPIMFVSTATTVTAAIFTTTDYVDQDGNTVVGTKTFTMPNAATALQSGFVLPLEDTDTAIRDIQQINVGTAASVGAAQIYGFEPLVPMQTPSVGGGSGVDMLGEHLTLPDMRPAVATSGTAAAYLSMLVIGTPGQSNVDSFAYMGFKNT